MRNKLFAYLMIAIFVSIISSCQQTKEEVWPSKSIVPSAATPLSSASKYRYYDDPLQNTNAILGRVLFYDKRLSLGNEISCSSCHKQSLGFGDSTNFSSGVSHLKGTRNAIAIQNLVPLNNPSANVFLFWNGREINPATMVADPIINPVEMGQPDLATAAQKIYDLREYRHWIDASYKDMRPFDQFTITDALSAFVTLMRSTNTRADLATFGDDELTPQEHAGKQLFFTKYNCGSCHLKTPGAAVRTDDTPVIYGDGTATDINTSNNAINFVNIGLDREYSDQGRGAISQNPADNGRFKIPDLHNVALTAPYMHDGRFKTLDEVLEHYSSGIQDHPNLDPQLRDSTTFQPRKMNISQDERVQLIAFLKSLTDDASLKDPKFSDPFKTN